jgi:hypothetical protein
MELPKTDPVASTTDIGIIADALTQAYDKIKQHYNAKEFTIMDIIPIATNIMQLVDVNKKLKGVDKQSIVIQIITRLVDESNLAPEQKELAHTLIDTVLPLAITAIIAASRGLLDLNKRRKEGTLKWPCCGKTA